MVKDLEKALCKEKSPTVHLNMKYYSFIVSKKAEVPLVGDIF